LDPFSGPGASGTATFVAYFERHSDVVDFIRTKNIGRPGHELSDSSKAIPTDRDAKTSMFLWLAATDPLRISRDPECGYGDAAGLTG
jgi:hypothetical protein